MLAIRLTGLYCVSYSFEAVFLIHVVCGVIGYRVTSNNKNITESMKYSQLISI